MNAAELQTLLEILKAMNLPELASQVLYVGIMLVLFKRYLLNGFVGFVRESVKQWLVQEEARIKAQTETNHSLEHLADGMKETTDLLSRNRTHYDDCLMASTQLLESIDGKLDTLLFVAKKRGDDLWRDKREGE